MLETDHSLFNHVIIESDYRDVTIFENHGYHSDLDDIVRALYKVIDKDVRKLNSGETKTLDYNEMSVFTGVKVFFTDYKLKINVRYDENLSKSDSEGGYDDKSYMSNDKGFSFAPVIVINAYGNSHLSIMRCISKTLWHELEHAHSDYDIFINSKGKKRLGDLYLQEYSTTSRGSMNDIENYVDKIVYFVDQSERNAHIGQLRKELEDYDGDFITANDLYKAIRSTKCYNDLIDAIGYLGDIRMMVNNDKDGYARNDFIAVVNALTGNSFKKFNPAFEFLKRRVIKSKMKFDEQAPKIAYYVRSGKHRMI